MRRRKIIFKQMPISKKEVQSYALVPMITYWLRKAGLKKDASNHKIHWLTNIAMAIFLSTVLFQLIDLFIAKDDPDKLFECFSIFTFCGMGALKLHSIVGSNERWLSLLYVVETLENNQSKSEIVIEEYESDSESTSHPHSKYIKNYSIRFHSLAVLLSRIYRSTLAIFILSPFAEYILRKMSGRTLNAYPHILMNWSPLDEFHIVGYVSTVVFEAIGAIYCVFVHIAFDLTSVGLMIFMSGQFTSLRKYSERIAGSGKNFFDSKERDSRAHYRIIQCHKTHILLVNTITELNKLLKNILGVYFLVTTLTLCSVAVRLNSEKLSVMQLVSLLQYMCATITQLYLFCHYGDVVLHESYMKMGEGPFGSAYWCLSPRIRRELILLSIGMSQPRRIRAEPFNYLDLPTFIQVVKTAYSCYAVLRK